LTQSRPAGQGAVLQELNSLGLIAQLAPVVPPEVDETDVVPPVVVLVEVVLVEAVEPVEVVLVPVVAPVEAAVLVDVVELLAVAVPAVEERPPVEPVVDAVPVALPLVPVEGVPEALLGPEEVFPAPLAEARVQTPPAQVSPPQQSDGTRQLCWAERHPPVVPVCVGLGEHAARSKAKRASVGRRMDSSGAWFASRSTTTDGELHRASPGRTAARAIHPALAYVLPMRLKLGTLEATQVGTGTGPAVLLCHGFGAPGDDLVPLAEALDPKGRWRWFFLEAPLSLGTMGIPGRAWWHIDMVALQRAMASGDLSARMEETPPGLAEARAAVEGALAALEQEHHVERSKLVVGGFSQGAMVTSELALHATPPFAGLAILSGALLSRARWQAAATERGAAVHVYQSHGRRDPILPFAGAEKLGALLQAAGATRTFVPHGGGHEIPSEVLVGLRAFLVERLG
jgi:phospholipase/carboxylesterase